jgi:hypothetical protein
MLWCVFSELLAMLADFIAAPIDPVAVHTLTSNHSYAFKLTWKEPDFSLSSVGSEPVSA